MRFFPVAKGGVYSSTVGGGPFFPGREREGRGERGERAEAVMNWEGRSLLLLLLCAGESLLL